MRLIPYNRKINAPITFLRYLEVIDLFILVTFGFLGPLIIASFAPVDIPLWHVAIWLVFLTFVLISIKIGRARGFVMHWISKAFRGKYYHPGKRSLEYFIFTPGMTHPKSSGEVFTQTELYEIRASLTNLKQTRLAAQAMNEQVGVTPDFKPMHLMD